MKDIHVPSENIFLPWRHPFEPHATLHSCCLQSKSKEIFLEDPICYGGINVEQFHCHIMLPFRVGRLIRWMIDHSHYPVGFVLNVAAVPWTPANVITKEIAENEDKVMVQTFFNH